jgi:glycopeptide antibiotics resistance protein
MARYLAFFAATCALTTTLLFAVAPGGWTWYLFFHGGNHVFAFILVAMALKALWPRLRNLPALAVLLVFGTLIEVAQRLIPLGHAAQPIDIVLDGLGAVIGLGLAAAVATRAAPEADGELS